MEERPQSVGIFGGTFDPVHNGHIAIAKSFLESNHIDSLWIFLNPSPPHKPGEEFAPYAARFKMLQAAFNSINNVVVSDLETSLPSPSYTIQTVSYLTESYPRHHFYLCMGKDSLASFKTWHKWQQILDHCTLLVADRPLENKIQIANELKDHVVFVDHSPVEVSSTEIRERVKNRESIGQLVPESVLSIIQKERLYTE